MSRITTQQIRNARPDVIQLLDQKTGAFIYYPAVKFPKRKSSVLVVRDGEDAPKPAKNYDSALRTSKQVLALERKKLAASKGKAK